LLHVPSLAPQVLLGAEGTREVALASQRAVPGRLMSLGHPFRHPELGPALAHVLGKAGFPDDADEV
jgi:NAD dependent epimerase/dehydratase family enzyme